MTNDESIVFEHEKENFQLERHPIILDEKTCILITTLTATNSLNHLFTIDYVDHRKEQSLAARDLIAQISPHCSVNFLWSLKEAINKEIESHSVGRREMGDGKEFPLDRPEGE